jgi:hypothetical protein
METVTVGFDPVAGDVTVARGAGRPVYHAPAAVLLAKHYGAEGVLYCEMRGPETTLFYVDAEARPATLTLVPAGTGRWRVEIHERR